MQTVIVLISRDKVSASYAKAKEIENIIFDTPNDIVSRVGGNTTDVSAYTDVTIHTLSEFMELFNKHFDFDDVWLSYVQVRRII